MSFSPIAIVGQACLLPGASSPSELWQAVVAGRDLLSSCPEGRWRIDPGLVRCEPKGSSRDATWSDRGGYVRGFDAIFDPDGFGPAAGDVRALDPIFQWTLHTARAALRSAGHDGPVAASQRARAGLVMGNLSFPTDGLSRLAESTWLAASSLPSPPRPDPRNRFLSGLPAQIAGRALGLEGGAFALDAACASSLYAIKLACDRLHDGRADLMVAGAVNKTDDLFIHIGFCALQALSRTGRSRPFHRDADGLMPAEGAGFVVLKRLEDAVRAGDRIFGVIRGVGLSNDGRGSGGMLAPSHEGQVRALRAAYREAGLQPSDISLLECHATGTPVGDRAEILSMGEVFAGREGVPIGSLKSNLGHLITVAGVAGLQKVLGAMEAGVRPPTLHADEPLADLAASPFRLLAAPEPWNGPRRAAVSAFGFGGNNAHLLVEAHDPRPASAPVAADLAPRPRPAVAVVACAVLSADGHGVDDFRHTLFAAETRVRHRDGGPLSAHADRVELPLAGLRFPPRDLAQALPQQILMLRAAQQALSASGELPSPRTSVLIGMQADAEIARYGGRWRAADWARAWQAGAAWEEQAREAFTPALEAAGVLGTMPNIPANRINSQLALGGPSFTVSADELSGIVALDLARRALQAGDIDAAVVGAVEMASELVHEQALGALPGARPVVTGDAAVALTLRRLDDAVAAGQTVLAVLRDDADGPLSLGFGDAPGALDLEPLLGRPHAASGLLHVAAAILSLRHAAAPSVHAPAVPWLPSEHGRIAHVTTRSIGGYESSISLSGAPTAPLLLAPPPRLHVFSGPDRSALAAAIRARRESAHDGPARAVLVASSLAELDVRARAAIEALAGTGRLAFSPATGVFLRERPIGGQLAIVFGGPASVYATMGRELVLALPELTTRLSRRFRRIREVVGWLYEPGADATTRAPVEKLWAASFLSQIHAELTLHTLGLRPGAAIGISSGETNALFATGAWHDLDLMFADIDASGLYTRELGGDHDAARRAWGLDPSTPVAWVNHRVLAAVEAVQEALASEPRAHLTIINSPHDVVIGGDREACDRVLARLGRERSRPLGYDLVVHCPEARAWAEGWRSLHHRPTQPIGPIRLYSHASCAAYEPTADAVADALLAQVLHPVDFPRLVHQAFADGVRIFLEHGPHGACSRAIETILGDRDDYLAIPLDLIGEPPLQQLFHALGALVAAGLDLPHEALARDLAAAWHRAPAPTGPLLTLPAHRPPPDLPPLPLDSMQAETPPSATAPVPQHMAPAPALPSALDGAPVAAAPPRSAPLPPQPWVSAAPSSSAPPPATPDLPPPLVAPFAASLPPAAFAAPPASPVAPPPAAPAPPAVHPWTPAPTAFAPAPPAPPALGAPGPASALGRLLAAHQQVAALHHTFLARQGEAHRRFLALRGLAPAAAAPPPAPFAVTALPPTPPAPEPAPLPAAPEPAAYPPSYTPVIPAPAAPPPPAPRVAAVAPPPAPAASVAPAPRPVAPTATAVATAPASTVVRTSPRPQAARQTPTGPRFSRADLEVLSSDKISRVFGPLFARQDEFPRQVRMPMPPLLLADRVTGLDAEPGSMKLGTIWTETDITWDSWYLHDGRMPPGIMIESGQADLLLISWLGADFLNRGERVYRLLGCELRYHNALPRPGETLGYEIHVDGHANHDGIRIFFFHYDCHVGDELRLSVRQGQAGFFTDEELAASNGILWDPATGERTDSPRLSPPAISPVPSALPHEALVAFSEGRSGDCFGPTHEATRSHVHTPRIAGGKLLLLGDVTHLDPQGGPWGRGYLRAVSQISPNDWFFEGHFKGDPCMPGTLMFEGCMQAMSVYLAAMGYTLDADGWRFEPVPEETYKLRCRGQVTPRSRELIYEVFVDEIVAGPVPMIFADLLCTVDGLKAFHCRRMGMRLVPDWPLSRTPTLERLPADEGPVASYQGFPFGYRSLLACAWGKPSDAFGEMYRVFDGLRRPPRLPGPPYHFVSRISRIDGEINKVAAGTTVDADYDVPPDAWYFAENGFPTMPSCVIMEATLQPCGWLASATGITLTTDLDLRFRNLDGTATWHREVLPDAGTLRTTTKLTGVSRSAGMFIVNFLVECRQGDAPIYSMKTVFGFFPQEALDSQVGISVSDEDRAWLTRPSDVQIDLKSRPERFCGTTLRLAPGKILMLDRITGYWPTAGKAGLGRMRAEKDVDAGEWFFQSHFYQDPVQPGSLGIEAMIQLLQAFLIQRGAGQHLRHPRFEPLALGKPLTWKYRGQVVPRNHRVTVEIEITELTEDSATAIAHLWVDGTCIYQAKNLAMRIVEGPGPLPPGPSGSPSSPSFTPPSSSASSSGEASRSSTAAATSSGASAAASSSVSAAFTPPPAPPGTHVRHEDMSLTSDPWLLDHRPTYTVPAVPAMAMIDLLAQEAHEATQQTVIGLRDARIHRWVPVGDAPVHLELSSVPAASGAVAARLAVFREASTRVLSRFEPAATAEILVGASYPPPPAALPPLEHGQEEPDPYASGALFHGPSLQLLRRLIIGPTGSSAILDASHGGAPRGLLHMPLLDAATHAIPHDELHRWSSAIGPDLVAYPSRILSLSFYGHPPSAGEVRVEARFDGFEGSDRFPRIRVQLSTSAGIWADLTLVEVLFPRGPLGVAPRLARRAFLTRRAPGLALSHFDGGTTLLGPDPIGESDWLPGTVASVYNIVPGVELAPLVAAKDHVARLLGLHPSAIEISPDGHEARTAHRPFEHFPIERSQEGETIVVRSLPSPGLDTSLAENFWAKKLGKRHYLVPDLYLGLARRFLGSVSLEDPYALHALRGKPVLFLANHQVGIESPLFSILAASLIEGVITTVAKAEHQTSWLGKLITHSFSYPGVVDPGTIVFFDRSNESALLELLGNLRESMKIEGKSLLVHVEGTRATTARTPVQRASSIWVDLALAVGAPIVPVRFRGALPLEGGERLEFPVGMGQQHIHIGTPIAPQTLQQLPLPARQQAILDAINALGPALDQETPSAPSPAFAGQVEEWRRQTGASEVQSVLFRVLEQLPSPSEDTSLLVRSIHEGRLHDLEGERGSWLAAMAKFLASPS